MSDPLPRYCPAVLLLLRRTQDILERTPRRRHVAAGVADPQDHLRVSVPPSVLHVGPDLRYVERLVQEGRREPALASGQQDALESLARAQPRRRIVAAGRQHRHRGILRVALTVGVPAGAPVAETCLLYTSPSPRDRQK